MLAAQLGDSLKPTAEVSQYQGQPEMVAALMADQVDAIMTDTTLLLTATSDILAARDSAAKARDSGAVVFGLTLALVIAFLLVQMILFNDGNIQKTFLRWDLMTEAAADVARDFLVNLKLALIAQVLVMIFGLFLANARLTPGKAGAPIRFMAIAYFDLFRAVPAIIVLYLIGFGLSLTGLPFISKVSSQWFAIIALTLTYSAYIAETYRSGIDNIHPSQWSAARSRGFSFTQILRWFILPQAIRVVIPPLLGAFIALKKDTSLVNVIGTMDAFNQAKFYASANFNLSSVLVVAILFVIITIPQTRFVDWMLERSLENRKRGQVLAFIEIEGLRKLHGSQEVLKGIDLSVDRHQIVSLIGASGSGKSPLLRCLNALEPINGGQISIDGDVVSGPGVDQNRLRRKVGMVLQSFNLFPHLSVEGNIMASPMRLLGECREAARDQARALLDRVQLGHRATYYPDQLSGSQQQRVTIVRAIAMRPEALLLDEITSALDPELVAEILNIVRDLAQDGMTMFLAAHEMRFSREVSDMVVFLEQGTLLAKGPPEQIFGTPTEPRTRQFLKQINEAGRL